MTLGLAIGAALFITAAVLGSKNPLWIPGVVLLAAAAATVLP